MRKTLFLLGLFLLTGTFSAVAKRKDADTLNVDQLKYRIVYNTKVVTDTTRTPYVYKQGQSYLDIGEKGVTRFLQPHLRTASDRNMWRRTER